MISSIKGTPSGITKLIAKAINFPGKGSSHVANAIKITIPKYTTIITNPAPYISQLITLLKFVTTFF